MPPKDRSCHNCRYCVLRDFSVTGLTRFIPISNLEVLSGMRITKSYTCMKHGHRICNGSSSEPYHFVCDDYALFSDKPESFRNIKE